MVRIDISNLYRKARLDIVIIRKLSRFVARVVGRGKPSEISIIFVSNSGIRELNRKYKKRDVSTDVLCFCFSEGIRGKGAEGKTKADIYISAEKAFSNSKRFDVDFKEEIYRYVVHGILHMYGFRDGGARAKKKMDVMQEKLLCRFLRREK